MVKWSYVAYDQSVGPRCRCCYCCIEYVVDFDVMLTCHLHRFCLSTLSSCFTKWGKGLNECVLQFLRIHKVHFCQDTSSNGFPRLIFLSPFSPKFVSNIANIQSWNWRQNCMCHGLSISLEKRSLLSICCSFFHNFHMLRSISNWIMMKSSRLPSLWQKIHDAYVVSSQAGLDSIAISIAKFSLLCMMSFLSKVLLSKALSGSRWLALAFSRSISVTMTLSHFGSFWLSL